MKRIALLVCIVALFLSAGIVSAQQIDGTRINVPNANITGYDLVLRGCGPNYFGTSAGTTAALTLSPTDGPAAYKAGLVASFTAGTTCAANATMNISSIGAYQIRDTADWCPLSAGDIKEHVVYTLTCDGVYFQVNL